MEQKIIYEEKMKKNKDTEFKIKVLYEKNRSEVMKKSKQIVFS